MHGGEHTGAEQATPASGAEYSRPTPATAQRSEAITLSSHLFFPFLPAPRTGPLLSGAAGSSSAHAENVRTTNKISIKLSFVSSSCVSWER